MQKEGSGHVFMHAVRIFSASAYAVHCKKYFPRTQDEDEGQGKDWKEFLSHWHAVLYATTEEAFEDAWTTIRWKYDENKAYVIGYLVGQFAPGPIIKKILYEKGD